MFDRHLEFTVISADDTMSEIGHLEMSVAFECDECDLRW